MTVTAATEGRKLAAAVADHIVAGPLRVWGFGEGHALLGLVAAADVLDRPDLLDHAVASVEPTLRHRPGPEDHLIAVEVLGHLAARVPSLDVAPAVDRWTEAITGAPRPVPGRPAVHRPDLQGLGRIVWVDCMHTDGPGMAVLGRDGTTQVEETATVLHDTTGLFHHGYDVLDDRPNGVYWGRGQGWALWGLVATLAHERSPALGARLDQLLDALAEHEHDGRWHTIIDDPRAPIENSVSALVAAGIFAGYAAGVVPRTATAMGERALAAACAATEDGALPVSEPTPVGSAATYLSRRCGVFPWGQGPLLVALAVGEGWQPFTPTGPDEVQP